VIAYVDTSSIVAIALRQPGYESIATKLASFEQLFTSTLLEAELRATLARAGVADDGSKLLREFYWIRPRRRLTVLIQRVLDQGVQLRGADVWHLASALYLYVSSATARDIRFPRCEADRGRRPSRVRNLIAVLLLGTRVDRLDEELFFLTMMLGATGADPVEFRDRARHPGS